MLADLGPRSPENPQQDTESARDAACEHLASTGNAAIIRLISATQLKSVGRASINAIENCFLLHARMKPALLKQLEGSEPNEQLLASHAIDADALTAFRGQRYQEFLRIRRATLLKMEQRKAKSVGLTYRFDADET